MAIDSTGNRASYDGNGTSTAFSFPYPFFSDSDLVVLLVNDTTGTSVEQTLTTHYTVSGAGDDEGGTVTMVTAPASGYSLVIYRDPELTQTTAFVDNNRLPAGTLNRALDKLTTLAQRNRDLVTRSVRLDDADSASTTLTLPLASQRARKAMVFDADGNLTVSADDYNDQAANATAQADLAGTRAAAALASANAAADSEASAQDILDDLTAATGSGEVGFIQAGTDAVQRTVRDRLRDMVSVKDFGAKGDGATDDTDAFKKAWAYALTMAAPALYIPAGRYKITEQATLFRVASNMEVYGDGMAASQIIWQPGSYLGSMQSLFAGPASGTADNVTLRDFAVRGDHDTTGYSQVSLYPILMSSVNNLRIHRVRITYSRVMGIAARSSFGVDVSECVVQFCARDGINTADCNYVRIANNRVEYCDDDGIAGHTQNYVVADRGYVVTGNLLRFCQGIKLLGGRSVTITGNTLEFCMGQGISIDTVALSGIVEGGAAVQGVVITGNTIKNCINRQYVDNANQGAPYIAVSAASARAGGLAAVPGRNDTATGTIVSPYPYFWTANSSSSTDPIADGHNLVISGNVLVRDAYAVNPISALGIGTFYTRTGPNDINLVAAAYSAEPGVRFGNGRFVNALLSNNVFMGIGTALDVGATTQLINTTVHGNIFYDCAAGMAVSGANTLHHSCLFLNNTFNLDPHHTHSKRGSNGAFSAAGDPTALLVQNANGFAIAGNTFKNLNRISDYNLTATSVLQGTRVAVLGNNVIECDPSVSGFNTANKGIGDLPRGQGFVLRVVDSDPASSTFQNTLNQCPIHGNAMPTSGKYIAGHVVWNNNPSVAGTAGSQYVVLGWMRITTGNAHALNTDWRELRCLSGT